MEENYEITDVGFVNEDYEEIKEHEFLLQGTVYGKQKDNEDNTYFETFDDFDFTYNTITDEIVFKTLDNIFTDEERTKIKQILLENLYANFKGGKNGK